MDYHSHDDFASKVFAVAKALNICPEQVKSDYYTTMSILSDHFNDTLKGGSTLYRAFGIDWCTTRSISTTDTTFVHWLVTPHAKLCLQTMHLISKYGNLTLLQC